MNRIDLYAENNIKGFYPLFKTDNAVYLYHYVYDDDEYDDEDNKYGFCVLYSDMYYPSKVSHHEQNRIDEYFYRSYCKASQYAKSKGASHVQLFSIYPMLKYKMFLFPDSPVANGIVTIDEDRITITQDIEETSNSDLFSIEAGLPKLINNRLVNGFVCVLSQSNKAFDFDLIIPKINRSSLQFGESEFIYKIHCTWNRIYKIASYYSKYGYSAIFWSASGLLLGHLYKFTSLPIPYDEDKTAQAIFKAKNDWDQMIYDNPFLEDANFSKPLNQWDYDLLQKARDNMKKTDS